MSCEYENPLNKKISKTSFAAIITMKLFKLVLYKKKNTSSKPYQYLYLYCTFRI